MISVEQAEKNISETNIYTFLSSLHDGEDYEREIQKDCLDRIRKEEERIKTGEKMCKSGVTKHIKYFKNQVGIHYQREVLYRALAQAIVEGSYVDK